MLTWMQHSGGLAHNIARAFTLVRGSLAYCGAFERKDGSICVVYSRPDQTAPVVEEPFSSMQAAMEHGQRIATTRVVAPRMVLVTELKQLIMLPRSQAG